MDKPLLRFCLFATLVAGCSSGATREPYSYNPSAKEYVEFQSSLIHQVETDQIDPGAALLLAEQVAQGKMSLREGIDWIGRLRKMRAEEDAEYAKMKGPCPTFKAYLQDEVQAGRLTQYAADTLYQFRAHLPGKSPEMARALAPCGL